MATGEEQPEPKLTVAEVIRGGTRAYVERHRSGQACLQVQSVLAKMSLCRTKAMGDRWYQCDGCEQLSVIYNSCGDRHCPQCRGAKRQQWTEQASKLLFEGVDYYQVVFTLPDTLSRIALANRMSMADLLCKSAWKSLSKTIHSEHGYDPAAMMVLHTWNQKLDAHWHVHAVVPGGGPSLDNSGWKTSRRPGSSTTGDYLVKAEDLRTAYRKIAIAHLNRLYKRGELKLKGEFSHLQDASQWKAFITELESKEWVSYIEPPPHENSKPEHVVRYLARYLTGGPISDHRVLEADEHHVTFLAREGKTTGGEDIQVPVTLTTDQFVQRWCLHIQPDQLTKTRYFGGWANTLRSDYMQRCQHWGKLPSNQSEHDDLGNWQFDESTICPHCGEDLLRQSSRTARPSWSDLLGRRSEHCPSWYRQSLIEDDRTFWDNLMGDGYSDWYDEYVKSPIEVARAMPLRTPPLQLTLWEVDPGIQRELESF